MSLGQLNFAGQNKVEVVLARLKDFEPPEGYYLAFSGGKDSIVVYDLAVRAGVKFDAHYSMTGIDPPEQVKFIREHYPDVERMKPKMSIFKAMCLPAYACLPLRHRRWCCELLKEEGGIGRRVLTGIRWQESARRGKRQMTEESSQHKTKIYVHPIIDWTEDDVWEYIKMNKLPYISLYDEGFKRIGCVLCPMVAGRQLELQLKRFPKMAEAWHRAALRLYDTYPDRFKKEGWNNGEEMWQWWISRKSNNPEGDNSPRLNLFGEE